MLTNAPKYEKFKSFSAVLAVVDMPESPNAGLNFSGYDVGMFQVIPSGAANVTVEIMEWSEGAGTFISASPISTFAGLGAGIPFAFTIPANGRILYPRVAVMAAGTCDIWAAGHRVGDISGGL